MKFTASDMTAMLTATGEPITIGATVTVGKFKAAGKLVTMFDGSVMTSGPMLIVSETDAALVCENDTIILISNTQYQATQKMPDGSGLVELELTKDF